MHAHGKTKDTGAGVAHINKRGQIVRVRDSVVDE